jgi:phenylacetate-CoA ligase
MDIKFLHIDFFNSVYHIDSTLPDQEQAALLKKIHPSLIVSYPTLLYSIAKAVSVKGYYIRPKAAIIGGEVLTPHVREYIKDVFKTRVVETYATIEFATIAKECLHGNWHINCTQNVVEFEDGKILVTGLINKALPLIRYEIGDVGSPKEGVCPCGRGLPMMQILEGRQGDFVILPDRREVSPLKFGKTKLVLDSTLAAKRYQIIQEDVDQFVIRVVPTERFTDEISRNLKEQLVKDLKYPVHVSVECVDNIPLIDDRKLRIIISRVKKR